MMKLLKSSLLYLLLVSTGLYAQNPIEKLDSIVFSLYYPDDSVGSKVFGVLDAYEKYGHLGDAEDESSNSLYINDFVKLFDSEARLPDDLSDSTIDTEEITITQYRAIAKQKGFQPYILIIERTDYTTARKQDGSGNYYAKVRIFKLFNSKAIIGANQKRGAIYTVALRLNQDASQVKITDISIEPGDEFNDFILGKYGRHIYSAILVSSDVNSLVVAPPQEYQPETVPTKSNFFLHAGYLATSFMQPEAMRNNTNETYTFNGAEHGWSIGIMFQKAFAPKDRFGVLLGVAYEENRYDFAHAQASFVYTQDQNGDPLKDLEGTPYDRKFVDVTNYSEKGSLTYFKPEVGLFFNMGSKHFNIQLLGSVGNAFLLSSMYQASSTVSYKGQIIGLGAPISQDALGFYRDKQTDFDGDHISAQNYFFYKAGAGLDFILSDHFGISLLFEYRSSFTNAFDKNTTELMFLDPDSGAGYISQFNTLSEPRKYNALALQAGIKIYLNGKR